MIEIDKRKMAIPQTVRWLLMLTVLLLVGSNSAWAVVPTVAGGQLNKATFGSTYSDSVLATTNSGAVITWEITTGPLPSWADTTHRSSADSLSHYFIIFGTPDAIGSVALTIEAIDSNQTNNNDNAVKTLEVVAAPVIDVSSLKDWTQNVSGYSDFVTVTGGAPPLVWNTTSGSPPNGLTLDGATGELTGTPTATYNSLFQVTVTDTNGVTAVGSISMV
ncbi:MAG: putative Ig domain-containing protein, partial [bacterium]|nr:putative Ig domain-containing protein [bacterium]